MRPHGLGRFVYLILFFDKKQAFVTGQKSENSNGFSLELKALFDTFSLEKKYQLHSSVPATLTPVSRMA